MEHFSIDIKGIFLVPGYTDMRKQIDGLAAILQYKYDKNPFDGCLYLFCGRSASRLKALIWVGDGFVLFNKRLENHRFKWPRRESEMYELSAQQLRWLLEGLNVIQRNAAQKIQPEFIC